MPTLDDSFEIGETRIPNRLYRAPLLECAGNGDDAVDVFLRELEPSAESGVGLIFQGATIVTEEGGRAAPGMTRVHDPDFVSRLKRLTDAVHEHGSCIFMQLEEGGLRSMETWHAGYREENPGVKQRAPSPPHPLLRAADASGFLELDVHVLSTDEVYELAEKFGRCAGYAVDAGYDGVHISGANMGIVQQFLSPFYNRRDDEFGGSQARRNRFLRLLHDRIREYAGDVPLVTKIPAETSAPPFVRPRISYEQGLQTAVRAAEIGYDAVVPVEVSTFWDASIVKGRYPERAWNDEGMQEGYSEAFGGEGRTRLVSFLNRLESYEYDFEPAWNADFARDLRRRVDIPVLTEGGVRGRGQADRLIGEACDAVGMGRPFYAEPRLGARLLGDDTEEAEAVCDNCNNCTVPQVTGARGVCRTPSVLQEAAELREEGAYD
jgi:2,4-dienoyl-CoA reductase-like NADH-dependent reductase (Old Yellow Enzyme family)